MPLWLWILLFAALVKIPLAGLMLWIPYRHDEALVPVEAPDSPEEDGGSKALPGGPLDPHPRAPLSPKPRRGPHGSPSPTPPARVRGAPRRRPVRARALHVPR